MKKSWFLGIFLVLAGSLNGYWTVSGRLANGQDILEELANLEKRVRVEENYFFPEFRLHHYERILHTNDASSRLRLDYAQTLMNAGLYDQAIEEYKRIKKVYKEDPDSAALFYLNYSFLELYLKKYLSITTNNKDNFHANELKEAIAIAQQCLDFPDAKKYGHEEKLIWHLNLLHKLQGSYPYGLSDEQLILFQDSEQMEGVRQMQAVSREAGLAEDLTQAGGVIMDDFNGDGLLDFIVSDMGLKGQLRYFVNHGKGKFRDHTAPAGLIGYYSGINVVQTDYNNDGWLDFFVTRGGKYRGVGTIPNSLFRNNGDDTFSDVTKEAGLYSCYPATIALWADINNDGWLDLFVGNDDSPGIPLYSELYLNKQDGSFTNITNRAGLMFRKSVQDACWLDFDQDNDLDLFIAIERGANLLFQNNSQAEDSVVGFSRVALNIFENHNTTVACQTKDLNNDGWDDLVLNVSYSNQVPVGVKFFINDQKGSFREWEKPTGQFDDVTPNAFQFWDINNDGEEEIILAQPFLISNQNYINRGAMDFVEGTYASGLNYLPTTYAFATGDIDLDGDQDLYMATGGYVIGERFPNVLYENKGSDNNWVVIKLIGIKSNKLAIGAKVAITIESEGIEKKIYRRVQASGKAGASGLQLEIGLAKADKIKTAEINWPGSRYPQQFHDMEVNKIYTLTEGSDHVSIR